MALFSFDNFVDTNPKGKAYLVDSCFLINSLIQDTPEQKLRKKLSGKVGFIYNVVIKNEVIHYTRYQLFSDAIANNKIRFGKTIKRLWEITEPHDHLKQVCNNGYAEMFREIFGVNGEKLEAEVDKVFQGCLYASGVGNKHAADWSKVYALAATYGLDSSDAMILNFAVGNATYSGLITSDADFRVCGDVQSKNPFDVIVPKGAFNTVKKKDWKAD